MARQAIEDPGHRLVDLCFHPRLVIDDSIHAAFGPPAPDHPVGACVEDDRAGLVFGDAARAAFSRAVPYGWYSRFTSRRWVTLAW